MNNSMTEHKEKIDAADREKIEAAVKETLAWLDQAKDQAKKEEFEAKQKEIEAIANPIMMKLYAAAGAAGGEGGQQQQMPGGMPAGFPGPGAGEPTVEEVD